MISLQEVMAQYPHCRRATPADGPRILEIIEATSIRTSDLQVSFDRAPDYFAFFPSQADEAFVFLLLNKDGTAHGLAVLSLRDFEIDGTRRRLGYGSDLRIMTSLTRHARVEWGRCYGQLVGLLPDIQEFRGASGTYTAVWDDNGAAQKAFVDTKKDRGFTYRPVMQYTSFSVWGHRFFSRRPSYEVRPARAEDLGDVDRLLFPRGPGKLTWSEAELDRTLASFGKTRADFLIATDQGRVVAVTLPVRDDDRRSLVVKSMPRALRWVGRLLPLFRRPRLGLGDRIKAVHLLFFRGESPHAAAFLDHLWRTERDFHILLISGPRSLNLEPALRKHGFLSSRIDGKLFEVQSSTDHRARPVPDLDEVEIGLL